MIARPASAIKRNKAMPKVAAKQVSIKTVDFCLPFYSNFISFVNFNTLIESNIWKICVVTRIIKTSRRKSFPEKARLRGSSLSFGVRSQVRS